MPEPELDGGLRLLTLTRLWTYPRYLHNIGRLRLSVTGPISYRALVYSAVVFGAAFVVLGALGVGWVSAAMVPRFLLPGLLVWWALRQAGEGARPVELVGGWVGWAWSVSPLLVLSPLLLVGLVPLVGSGRPVPLLLGLLAVGVVARRGLRRLEARPVRVAR